ADELSMEDRIVENLSALFLFVSSMILAVSSYQLIRKEEFTTAIFAALLALLFFVICMEEISWMQRVLNIETSEVFLQLNEQEEINLHNIFTNTAEKIYYAGAFVLLTAAPFL